MEDYTAGEIVCVSVCACVYGCMPVSVLQGQWVVTQREGLDRTLTYLPLRRPLVCHPVGPALRGRLPPLAMLSLMKYSHMHAQVTQPCSAGGNVTKLAVDKKLHQKHSQTSTAGFQPLKMTNKML